jgi:hypothetical protein
VFDFASWDSKEDTGKFQTVHLQDRIFIPPYYPSHFKKNSFQHKHTYKEILCTDVVVKNRLEIVPVRKSDRDSHQDKEGGWKAEARAGITWGGNEKPKYHGSVSGEVYDDHGNYAGAEAKRDSDGKKNAEIYAGHELD